MRFEPIFKYYAFPTNTNTLIVEIDPQDGSDWPYHFLIRCELNPTTGQWDLYKNEWTPLSVSAPDKTAAIKEACCQLVTRLNAST
jgi:hypothetical protein